MGLDSVEIVVEVENCFGIEIQDEDAANMRTVQHMVDYVWDRIEHKDAKACLTQILFFRLRKFFCENLNIKPALFTPTGHFTEIGNKKQFDALWAKLEEELKLDIPNIYTGERILLVFKVQSDTVQDLIESIIYTNIKELGDEYSITKSTVFSVVASITHSIVGAPRKDIVPSAEFVKDLGVS